MDSMAKPLLTVLLANPRGFCAGVERAVHIVEAALDKYGAPVYVRHEIVHNRFVVECLERRGAVFVDELDAVPDGVPVIFSAHGVPKAVPDEAARRGLLTLDATCPLVDKVHREAERHYADGFQIILIGHAGHPEVVGTMGHVPPGAVLLVENAEQAETVAVARPDRVALITQTTLSVDDTAAIRAVLRRRFPSLREPRKEDICYATTNRQAAVKSIARRCQALLVVGAPNSSNSLRLVEVARDAGCPKVRLVQRACEIDFADLGDARTIGITAGASAPEVLVDEVVAALRERYQVGIERIAVTTENVRFGLPRALAS